MPGVGAAGVATDEDVLPERFRGSAWAPVGALHGRLLALGSMTEEEQPPLLLSHILLLPLVFSFCNKQCGVLSLR